MDAQALDKPPRKRFQRSARHLQECGQRSTVVTHRVHVLAWTLRRISSCRASCCASGARTSGLGEVFGEVGEE